MERGHLLWYFGGEKGRGTRPQTPQVLPQATPILGTSTGGHSTTALMDRASYLCGGREGVWGLGVSVGRTV